MYMYRVNTSSLSRSAMNGLSLLMAVGFVVACRPSHPTIFPQSGALIDESNCHISCFSNFVQTGNASQDVQTLAGSCGQACGMSPVGEVVVAAQSAQGAVHKYPITLSSAHCYRIIAVGAAGVRDLDSALTDGADHVLRQDTARDNFPILSTFEPYCPPYSGQFEIVMSVADGAGDYAYQVLQDGSVEPAPQVAAENAQRECARTCYQGFVPFHDAARDLQELGNRCGTTCGMTALAPVQFGEQGAADPVEAFAVELQRGQCYRLLAAGDAGLVDLDAAIADPAGNLVIHDTANDSWPVLGVFEPYCPSVTRVHRVLMSAASGSGTYGFQLWHAPRQ